MNLIFGGSISSVPNQIHSVSGFLYSCIACYRSVNVSKTTKDNNVHKYINFTELLQHFVSVQDKHHQHKQATRAMTLLEKSMMTLNT